MIPEPGDNVIKLLILSLLVFAPFVSAEVNQLSNGEVCISAESIQLEGADYKKNDVKDERSLCKIDFNIPESSSDYKAVALCPKLNSSFPGVDIIKLADGVNKLDFQRNSCTKKPGSKNSGKIAKFKYSTSCSKSSSIIGYYHISRALGIKTVPVAVARTMNINTHKEVVERAKVYVNGYNGLIGKTWLRLDKDLRDQKSSIVINGGTHSLGVLSVNPKGEQKTYNRLYFHADNQDARLERFLTNSRSVYVQLINPEPISAFISNKFNTESYGLIQSMKDASDMLVLDTIFGQNDRFGNFHSEYKFAFIQDGKVSKLSLKDVKKMIKESGDVKLLAEFNKAKDLPKDMRKPIRIRRKKLLEIILPFLKNQGINAAFYEDLILKDNDCGLRSKNPFMNKRVIEKVNHLNSETYLQLVNLYNAVIKNSSLDSYLKNNLLMSESDLNKFKDNLTYTAEVLISKYSNGQLHLDLDPSSHFLK